MEMTDRPQDFRSDRDPLQSRQDACLQSEKLGLPILANAILQFAPFLFDEPTVKAPARLKKKRGTEVLPNA